jgi:sugar lactone lactonase YvrE
MDSMNSHMLNELPKTYLGEGPLWDANALIYVDIAEGMIHRHSFEKSTHETISVGENVGFAVIDTQGEVVAGIGNGSIYRFRFGTRDRELLAPPARELEQNLANDGKCDRSGRLWTGTKNKDEDSADTGYLARFDARGHRLIEWLHPVHISNGLAWSPDNTKLYYNDSTETYIPQFCGASLRPRTNVVSKR